MKLKESENDEELEEEEEEDEEAAEDGQEPAAETDNVGDASVEINVEELIHEFEGKEPPGNRPANDLAARRRLEELMEKKRAKRDLEDFEDYDV